MKHIVYSIAFLFILTGCTTEEIIIYNDQVTPDLSNPIIQKLTNITLYNKGTVSEWESTENIPSPSETVASLLYTYAWQSIHFNRDGTSQMIYFPPMLNNTFVYCQGTWTVSEDEENTIILATKTPVSNVIAKIKVLNLETKDNVISVELSFDFGNRFLRVNMDNSEPSTAELYLELFDLEWFDSHSVKTTPLVKEDFIGTWATSAYELDTSAETSSSNFIRSTYLEDLLNRTPVISTGLEFDFHEDGKAKIVYSDNISNFFDSSLQELEEGQKLYSNATWEVKGNKLTVETDELVFLSIGEVMFGISVYGPDLTVLRTDTDYPFRILENRFYTFEIISQEDDGNWCRVTSNDNISYMFLKKRAAEWDKVKNVKAYKN